MWCCLSLSVSTAESKGTSLFWAWISPVFTAFLLLKVSGVPMVEKAGNKKWGHLKEY